MSEFKFACPVCGQHITCDSGSSGSTMACPTCFRQLVVPQASAIGGTNLVLNTAEVQSRSIPLPGNGGAPAGLVRPTKSFPWAASALGLMVCTAGVAAFVFRGKLLSMLPKGERVATNSLAVATEPVRALTGLGTNWTLNLATAKIPESPVAGQINGQSFTVQRATLRGGMLILWQGAKWPPEAGMAVEFFAKQAEELAGQTILIEAAQANAPKLMVRWKDEQGQSVTQEFQDGYALRVEFGELTGPRLAGKIYLAAPDDGKSYLAGTFDADIHRPPRRKPQP
jgi:hypothetical protein